MRPCFAPATARPGTARPALYMANGYGSGGGYALARHNLSLVLLALRQHTPALAAAPLTLAAAARLFHYARVIA